MAGFPAGGAFRRGVFTPLPTPKPAKGPTLNIGSLESDLKRVAGESRMPRAGGAANPGAQQVSIFGKGAPIS